MPTVAFAGGTLDRAAHLRGEEADGLRRLDTSRAVLIGADQTVAVTDAGELARVPTAELPANELLTFLGLEATGAAAFAYDAADDPTRAGRLRPAAPARRRARTG